MPAPLPQTDSVPSGTDTVRPPSRRGWVRLPRGWKRRTLFIGLYLLFCGGLLYGARAVYWNWRAGVPLTDRATVWDFFYPEIRRSGLLEAAPAHDDRFFDVVLFGGSVLEPYWGDVERCLLEKLTELCGDEYRLFNLAAPLSVYVKSNRLGTIVAAETGFVIARDPDTVRAPDIGFIAKSRMPASGRPIKFWVGAPDLAVETMSPWDTVFEVDEKVQEWIAAGTRMVWVVNPRQKTVQILRSNTTVRVLSVNDRLDGEDVVPGFSIAVAEIFE